MKKLSIEMPVVRRCDVKTCAYNLERGCHARAITIGDPPHPACDTFLRAARHPRGEPKAGVGACKIASCVHNVDFECQAESIRVGLHGDHGQCETYSPRLSVV